MNYYYIIIVQYTLLHYRDAIYATIYAHINRVNILQSGHILFYWHVSSIRGFVLPRNQRIYNQPATDEPSVRVHRRPKDERIHAISRGDARL